MTVENEQAELVERIPADLAGALRVGTTVPTAYYRYLFSDGYVIDQRQPDEDTSAWREQALRVAAARSPNKERTIAVAVRLADSEAVHLVAE